MPRRRSGELAGVNLLDLVPRRRADWSEQGGIVVVSRQAPECWWRAPLAWIGYRMSVKRVRLDEVGSFVWKLLDGRQTVAQVAVALRTEFGERVEPAEERLGEMVRTLHDGGLVTYAEESPSVEAHSDGAR
jgi:hypothetical protein